MLDHPYVYPVTGNKAFYVHLFVIQYRNKAFYVHLFVIQYRL